MYGLSYYATDSDALSIDDDLFDGEDFDVDLINDLFATTGDMSTDELLVSINNNLTQINLYVGFTVTVGFAIAVVYITLRPIFCFFD